MPDAVVGPAQVGVRDLDAVPEVELDAGLQRVPLRTGGETRTRSLPLFSYFSRRSEKQTAPKCSDCDVLQHLSQTLAECERRETEVELQRVKRHEGQQRKQTYNDRLSYNPLALAPGCLIIPDL